MPNTASDSFSFEKQGFLFPGQGSQRVGMGESFLSHHAQARLIFEEVNDALGVNLKALCLNGPQETLTLTENAQPAVVTVGYIAYRLLAERAPIKPFCTAGHSVGEYTALIASGALSLSDAVCAVRERGKLMQAAVPAGEGAMAAIIGMDGAALEDLCKQEAGEQVVRPANFNTPGQIVISGHTEAVDRVLAKCKGKRLEVSAPFHSPLLAPVSDQLEPTLQQMPFEDAAFPVVTNYANLFMTEKSQFMESLLNQIPSPVRWESGIRAMIAAGTDCFIECGHGKVLSSMMKKIDSKPTVLSVEDDQSLKNVAVRLEK